MLLRNKVEFLERNPGASTGAASGANRGGGFPHAQSSGVPPVSQHPTEAADYNYTQNSRKEFDKSLNMNESINQLRSGSAQQMYQGHSSSALNERNLDALNNQHPIGGATTKMNPFQTGINMQPEYGMPNQDLPEANDAYGGA